MAAKKTEKSKRSMLGLSLQPRLMDRLTYYAETHGVTKTQVAVWALDQFLSIHESYTPPPAAAPPAAPEPTAAPSESEEAVEKPVKKRRRRKKTERKAEVKTPPPPTLEDLLARFNTEDQDVIKEAVLKAVKGNVGLFHHTLKDMLKKWKDVDVIDIVAGCATFVEEDVEQMDLAATLNLLHDLTIPEP